jgi:transcriptional regulator with XRE-family HTH domain
MEFKDRLREVRKARGLTQRELAEKIKSNNNTVSNWEKGVSRPTAPVVDSIAHALGLSPFELLGDFTLYDMTVLYHKRETERTPEEAMALAFAAPLLFQLDIRPEDEPNPASTTAMKDIEQELAGTSWQYMLEDGGRELLFALGRLGNNGKAIIFEMMANLLRVPGFLHEMEEVNEKRAVELDCFAKMFKENSRLSKTKN